MSAIPSLDIDPFGEDFLADPYAHHGVLREAGPVFRLDRIGTYGMARYSDVRAALRDHETYCSGRGVGLADFAKETPWRPPSLMLEADPPLHDRARKIMNPIVSITRLNALKPQWEGHAHQLAGELAGKRRFDAVRDLAEVYPMMVFPDAVGVPVRGREKLLVYGAAVFDAFGPRNAVYECSAAAAADAIGRVADACRRENLAAQGWGTEIHQAAKRGDCSEGEAERLVRSLLSAGIDTTINSIAHMILGFALFPEQWTKLRAKPELARKAFDESLRWNSTVQTFFRTTTRTVSVDDFDIPRDSKVLLFLAAANRDPRQWPEPERFDIERTSGGHVAFGLGIHQCLGQLVARMEGELVLQALIPHVRTFRLAGAPVRRLNNTLHALASLPVEIESA